MKKLFFAPFFCLLLMVCLNPPHDNEYDPENSNKAYLAGNVYNSFTNNSAIANATVILTNDTHGWSDTVFADNNGWYEFDSIDPGLYTINAEAGHYMTELFPESLPAGTDNDSFDLYARKAIFDFEDESLNTQEPKGFSVVNGTWAVVDDPDKGHMYQGITPGSGLADAVSNAVLKDFYYESTMQVDTSSGGAFFTGILFRYQDLSNFYCVIFSTATITLIRAYGGVWTPIDTLPLVFSDGTWYVLSVDCVGDHIQVYLDNGSTPIFDVYDNTFSNGKVGLFAEHFTTSRFDDIYMEMH
jgi:hypothetical protein